jgi:hypothetical protein
VTSDHPARPPPGGATDQAEGLERVLVAAAAGGTPAATFPAHDWKLLLLLLMLMLTVKVLLVFIFYEPITACQHPHAAVASSC